MKDINMSSIYTPSHNCFTWCKNSLETVKIQHCIDLNQNKWLLGISLFCMFVIYALSKTGMSELMDYNTSKGMSKKIKDFAIILSMVLVGLYLFIVRTG